MAPTRCCRSFFFFTKCRLNRDAEGKGTCLYGVCLYCKAEDSVCAQDGTTDLLEGTAILWLPSHLKLTKRRSPWQRTYKDGRNATWQVALSLFRFILGCIIGRSNRV